MKHVFVALAMLLVLFSISVSTALACGGYHQSRPSASILGPCGDPKYAFVMANPTSHDQTFVLDIVLPTGAPAEYFYNVTTGTQRRTKYFHVLPGSNMRVSLRVNTWTSYFDRTLTFGTAVDTVNTGIACPSDAKHAVITTLNAVGTDD